MDDHGSQDVDQQQSLFLKHLYRGSELLINDRIDEAREVLEEATRIDPEDPKGLSLLGLVYFRLEELERAQQVYELLVGRFPLEASLRVNLGLVYMKQARAEEARQEMLRAVEIDASHQRAYGYLGLLHSEAGEHREARIAFAKAGQDAMVQRMDDLLAQAQPQAPHVEGGLHQGRQPAESVEVWAEPEPGASPAPGPPSPMPGMIAPGGAMIPMMSDAMTQPVVAAPLFAGGEPGAGYAPVPAPGPAASPEPDSEQAFDAAFDAAFDMDSGTGKEPAPEPTQGQSVVVTPVPGDPEKFVPQQELWAEDASAALKGAAGPPQARAEDASTGLEGAAEQSQAWAEDVSTALDGAVGPPEPWPSGGGAPMPGDAMWRGASADGAPPDPGSYGADPSLAAPSSSGHAGTVPIFAFATTELVDLLARRGRMCKTAGGLLQFPVEEDGYFRSESLLAEVGGLRFDHAFRRSKGANTKDPMVDGRGCFLKARGEGVILCDPGEDHLVILDLFDDFVYVRSEHLFAFESTLHWENGKIRGASGVIPLVHIRGEGRLALALPLRLHKIRLVPDAPAFVAEDALLGWVGRVIPQIVPRDAGEEHAILGRPLLRCEGEGVLLVAPNVRGPGEQGLSGGEA